MNPDLHKLQPYPFERLNKLKGKVNYSGDLEHIPLSIGEPKHPTPHLISEAVLEHLHQLSTYPLTRGGQDLRQAIVDWLTKRFQLGSTGINAEDHVLPVNGTREALFAFAQAVVKSEKESLVLMPNPFYQIYEGATFLAGATPVFLDCNKDNGYLPDFSKVTAEQWKQCELLYICSPGNPTGAVIPEQTLHQLILLAEKHDFIIASDECYSEIYFDESAPPVGLLQAAASMGNTDFKNCMVFHSLSKRSNAPGLRSGFVAGDADIIKQFLSYRTYHGCAMPLHHQAASIKAWKDEEHVAENRRLYKEKFSAVLSILKDSLNVNLPQAGFYLWAETPINDQDFALGLYQQQNVTVLPGSYLSRKANGINPGENYVRMALVAPLNACIDAANRINDYCKNL